MTSMNFWDRVKGYDKVLIFQSDSEILRGGIEEFFDWDYCGAPWQFQECGGNGGISLRSVDVMTKIVKSLQWSPQLGYEDVYFSNAMCDAGMNIAPRDICKKFSCETIFELGTWAAHAIDKHLTPQQCKQIRSQY